MLRVKPLFDQLTIKTKDLEFRKFDLDYVDPIHGDFGWAQREFVAEIERQYNSGLPVRALVLKARQLGLSTATEGLMFLWGFLHHGTNGLVMAHENTPSTELFEMTKLYWDTWPFRSLYTLKSATKATLAWAETRSRLRVATARNIASGRASTLHAVHASECAFYPDPETLMLGLSQTIPQRHGTIVVLESTANGVGNWFYEQWMEATEGGSDYVPLFFPWWRHPEYRITTTICTQLELDADEKELFRIGASYEHIAWRRWAIFNLAGGSLSFFMQEYPATPDEAFITTGRPIFSAIHLRKCFKEEVGFRGRLVDDTRGHVLFERDVTGPVTIYRNPRRDSRTDRYFVAGDPSESIGGDPSCAHVINRQTMEQVAVYHNRVNPIHFGYDMMRLGKYYNGAMLCPEVEGGGQATVATILTAGYPNVWTDKRADRLVGSFNVYGWSTNFQRKQWAVGTLQRLVLDGSMTIHDRITYNQMLNYVEHENGYWGNNDSKTHDDAVMALSIGVTASVSDGPFTADSTQSIIRDIYAQEFA